ncbi:MAG: hypothetical protein EBR30_04765 [Cytophagia bacterium]|nr:hypothetical protein [Cytophagia bacterium]
MAVHILGIRHHGVGSAHHVREQLALLNPDIILVEGPPELTEVFSSVGHQDLVPPVAIMVYNVELPQQSVFYPFAVYSPEWVAIEYANRKKIPVRAMDLPAAVSFSNQQAATTTEQPLENKPVREPIAYLAEAAGFTNSEAWWDQQFEAGTNLNPDHFEAVMHAMDALRSENIPSYLDRENILREAFMRNIIRQAQNEMFQNIVVVCGAWHAPALIDVEGTAKTDAKLLKEIAKNKLKIGATWIPWTNGRLSMASGYGAGIYSPGWYEHQWLTKSETEIRWLTQVARTFRDKDIDVSTAHVMEAYHLAQALTHLRNKSKVSLEELNEATLAVMCMGDTILLDFIREKLIVANKLGKVPADIPKVPLQEDFEQIIKTLRLRLSAAPKTFDLDLRKDIDLSRSIFFHRLDILEIPWIKRTTSRTKGTFKESWVTEWQPEMMVALIDKAFYGNTIEAAAQAIVLKNAQASNQVSLIAGLIQQSIPAELYEKLDELLFRINELTAVSADMADLMTAIPPLVEVSRYGNVRKSDAGVLNSIVQQLLTKVFIGLPNAVYGLDEDNSIRMFNLMVQVNQAVRLYEDAEIEAQWFASIHVLIEKDGVHGIIRGCVCRLLLDAQQFNEAEADQRISFALSAAHDPHQVAGWLEGFLRGSGMILIYDQRLWNLLYNWVKSLPDKVFRELLVPLRRAFSRFEFGERRQIGEKAKHGLVNQQVTSAAQEANFDATLAESILPILKQFLN